MKRDAIIFLVICINLDIPMLSSYLERLLRPNKLSCLSCKTTSIPPKQIVNQFWRTGPYHSETENLTLDDQFLGLPRNHCNMLHCTYPNIIIHSYFFAQKIVFYMIKVLPEPELFVLIEAIFLIFSCDRCPLRYCSLIPEASIHKKIKLKKCIVWRPEYLLCWGNINCACAIMHLDRRLLQLSVRLRNLKSKYPYLKSKSTRILVSSLGAL